MDVGSAPEGARHAVADLFGYLAGSWTIGRDVTCLRTRTHGRFEGELRCDREPAGSLLMHERGTLNWSGVRREAFRTTRAVATGEPGVAEVCFEDGRPFHDLDLRTGDWTAVHHCGADTYRGSFAVADSNTWTVVWRVHGPDKELRLASRLVRIVSPGR